MKQLWMHKAIKLVSFCLLIASGVFSQEQITMKYTTPTTTVRTKATYFFRMTFEDSCDYYANYCLKAYITGKVCGRSPNQVYHTFKNYCMLDYVNCMERFELWQIVHMGECFDFPLDTEYLLYQYDDDDFLNETFVIENH